MKLKVIVTAFFFPSEDTLLIGEGLVKEEFKDISIRM